MVVSTLPSLPLTQLLSADCQTANCCRTTTSREVCAASENELMTMAARILMIAITSSISTKVKAARHRCIREREVVGVNCMI